MREATKGSVAPRLLVFHPALVFGGTERFLTLVLPRWKRRYHIYLITTEVFKPLVPAGVELHLIKREDLFRRFRPLPLYFRLLRRLKPARILVFVIAHQAAVFCLAAYLAGLSRSTIIRYDGFIPEDLRKGLLFRLLLWANRWARAVIVPSRALGRFVVRELGVPPTRLKVIPNPVNCAAFPPRQGEGSYALWVGRIVPEKNISLLLEAAGLFPSVKLKVLGEGPLLESYRAQAPKNVEFLGFRRDVRPYLREARFLVHTCRAEGFGYSLLEALAAGLPVLSQDCPCGPDEILDGGRYGLLFKEDPEELAFLMKELWTSPRLRAFFEHRARQRARQYDLSLYPEELP